MTSAIWAVSSCGPYGTLSPETEYNNSEHLFSFYIISVYGMVVVVCEYV